MFLFTELILELPYFIAEHFEIAWIGHRKEYTLKKKEPILLYWLNRILIPAYGTCSTLLRKICLGSKQRCTFFRFSPTILAHDAETKKVLSWFGVLNIFKGHILYDTCIWKIRCWIGRSHGYFKFFCSFYWINVMEWSIIFNFIMWFWISIQKKVKNRRNERYHSR